MALGFSLSAGSNPRRQLLGHLREKRLLLILDGYERLVEGAGLVTDILEAAPGVRILATSRIALRVRGEHLFRLTGMAFPDSETAPDAIEHDAVKLFLERARRADQGFDRQLNDLGHVVRICHQVSGMPLAIILAAAWVEMLTPAEISAEIAQSLDFLETDLSGPDQQRSMRAVFDRTWGLLTERQRELFQALSVFRGGFTRQAAQQVTGASLRELKGLVDRSLLDRIPTGRYEVHELLRRYAADNLLRLGKLDAVRETADTVRDRHCAYFVATLERWGAHIGGTRQQEAMAEMDVELGNARLAWDWAVDRGQLARLDRAAETLFRFYKWRGRLQEGATAFENATSRLAGMASPLALHVRARVLGVLGMIRRDLGDHDRSLWSLHEGLALLDSPELADRDTRYERATLLRALGGHLVLSDPEQAGRLLDQGLALSRALGDRFQTEQHLYVLGQLFMARGWYEQAESQFRELIAEHGSAGDPIRLRAWRRELAEVFYRSGQFERARCLLARVLADPDETEDIPGVANSRLLLGLVEMSLGHYENAHSLGQLSMTISRRRYCQMLWIEV